MIINYIKMEFVFIFAYMIIMPIALYDSMLYITKNGYMPYLRGTLIKFLLSTIFAYLPLLVIASVYKIESKWEALSNDFEILLNKFTLFGCFGVIMLLLYVVAVLKRILLYGDIDVSNNNHKLPLMLGLTFSTGLILIGVFGVIQYIRGEVLVIVFQFRR